MKERKNGENALPLKTGGCISEQQNHKRVQRFCLGATQQTEYKTYIHRPRQSDARTHRQTAQRRDTA